MTPLHTRSDRDCNAHHLIRSLCSLLFSSSPSRPLSSLPVRCRQRTQTAGMYVYASFGHVAVPEGQMSCWVIITSAERVTPMVIRASFLQWAVDTFVTVIVRTLSFTDRTERRVFISESANCAHAVQHCSYPHCACVVFQSFSLILCILRLAVAQGVSFRTLPFAFPKFFPSPNLHSVLVHMPRRSGQSHARSQKKPASSSSCVKRTAGDPPDLLPGVAMLKFVQPYVDHVFSGAKDLEIRAQPLRAMSRFIAYDGHVHGWLRHGKAFEILTDVHWRALRPRHHVPSPTRPYTRTFAHPIIIAVQFDEPVPYAHKRGAIGTPRFWPRPVEKKTVKRGQRHGAKATTSTLSLRHKLYPALRSAGTEPIQDVQPVDQTDDALDHPTGAPFAN